MFSRFLLALTLFALTGIWNLYYAADITESIKEKIALATENALEGALKELNQAEMEDAIRLELMQSLAITAQSLNANQLFVDKIIVDIVKSNSQQKLLPRMRTDFLRSILGNERLASRRQIKGKNLFDLKLFKLLVNNLEEIHKLRDPHFDANDLPSLNVLPPKGAHIPPGGDPASIVDKELRAEYERLISLNNIKSDNYRLQTQLKRVVSVFADDCNSWLKLSAIDQDELKRETKSILSRGILDKEITALLFKDISK